MAEEQDRRYHNLRELEVHPGWKALQDALAAEGEACVAELMKPLSERERDYQASRLGTLGWVLSLPKSLISAYAPPMDDYRPTPREPFDPASPVPPGDE